MILMGINFFKYSNGYFHLYETLKIEENQTVRYYDCFYSSTTKTNIPGVLTLQPYCIRPDNNYFKRERSINQSQIRGNHYTFFQLRQLDVTGRDLYEWSAPIDTIEHYELYLIDSSHIKNGNYYNCSSAFWFGSFCQYTLNSLDAFTDIISERFNSRFRIDTLERYTDILSVTNGTCYIHLNCNRGPSPICLDWREICDRKCDCLNSCIDEENCFKLEINECEEDQYRCNNGMCISQHLLLDRNEFVDCLDGSDESILIYNERRECLENPDFNCDTLTCSWFDSFSCGNGQCLRDFSILLSAGSFCYNARDLLQIRVILMYETSSEISERCWSAIICKLSLDESIFGIDCNGDESIGFDCPSIFFFPSSLALFRNFRFVYEQNNMDHFEASYICFETKECDESLTTSVFINGTACKHMNEFPPDITTWSHSFLHLHQQIFSHLKQLCSLLEYTLTNSGNCSDSSLFNCAGTSKCISKYRLQDENIDCYQSYDEVFNETCSLNLSHRFYCPLIRKCIPQAQLKDSLIDCSVPADEFVSNRDCFLYKKCDRQNIIFSKICDGFTEIASVLIDNQNETDETNCQYWPCDTHYTRCDSVWNCYNGADEVNCLNKIYPFNCQINEHHCVQLNSTAGEWGKGEKVLYTCLPIKLAGNKQVDCLGSTDERDYCRLNYPHETNRRYRCWNDTKCIDVKYLCDCSYDCPLGDDEKICSWIDPNLETCDDDYFTCRQGELIWRQLLCISKRCSDRSDALICDLTELHKPERKHFSIGNYSFQYPDISRRHDERLSIETKALSNRQENEQNNDLLLQWYCNQGVLVYSIDQKFSCFCPPAYYGDRCQYQNEFLGLILNIRRISPRDYFYVFRIIIVLLDEKRNSLFHEQILYESPCEKRYQMYLLYPNRSNLMDRNYSVHLNIYSIHRLSNIIRFRTSYYHTIPFTFLPVNRLVINLPIAEKQAQPKSCESIVCQNGKCFQYENVNQYYCQCNPGWFDTFCHLHRKCDCSSQSICAGTDCICPLGKSGLLCYISEIIPCQENICQHGGTCIPGDQRILARDSPCICSEEYEGKFCEKRRIDIIIRFNGITIPGAIFVHYFISRKSRMPDHFMQFKRIPVYENNIILYPSMQYDIAFAQFDSNYYLIFINFIPARQNISTAVILSNKCSYIEELLDRTTFLDHPLKRIKYYHQVCEYNHHLQCFYDETQLCLCTKDHQANCFDFNRNETSSCNASDYCENNGKCFVNDLTCPTKSICVCEHCYYGNLCQFTTSGSVISLDSIIGYHIQPNLSFLKQSFIIKFTTGITILMLILGIIANLLSLITFTRKQILQIGCGIYLLSSSIISFLTMIIFAYKFWSLLAIQMSLIKNDIFLIVNCKIVDFLLRFLPTTVEWLNACVAIERALNIILGTSFDQRKSQMWAIFTVTIVILINVGSALHDPFNRRLLEDTEEQRIWCIVSYTHSSWLNIYNETINIIHFFAPFSINFISALIIIGIAARNRSVIRKNQTYREHLREQLRCHKHLLISSTILVILALPRLFISFISGCMKSVRDPWLFLAAYLISFIPLILIFPIFVLPSKTYKMEFILSLIHYGTIIRRYFRTS